MTLNVFPGMELKEWVNFDLHDDKISEKELTQKTEPELTEEEIQMAKKTAYECNIYGCSTISEAITEFLDMCKDWRNFFVEICWKKLYSVDTKTEDDAYMQIFWKTKIEQEKVREKYDKKRKLERKKKELEAIEKVPWRIEEGKKYVDEEKWWNWESYVNSSARDMYHWMDIDDTLKLLKLIDEWKSWQEIQKVFDKNCGVGFYYSVVRNRVVLFSKKWEEADKYLWKNW